MTKVDDCVFGDTDTFVEQFCNRWKAGQYVSDLAWTIFFTAFPDYRTRQVSVSPLAVGGGV